MKIQKKMQTNEGKMANDNPLLIYNITCPRCKNSMKYMPRKSPGMKKCVYCGKIINTKKQMV